MREKIKTIKKIEGAKAVLIRIGKLTIHVKKAKGNKKHK